MFAAITPEQRRRDEYELAMERFLARAREPRKLQWVNGHIIHLAAIASSRGDSE